MTEHQLTSVAISVQVMQSLEKVKKMTHLPKQTIVEKALQYCGITEQGIADKEKLEKVLSHHLLGVRVQ